MKRLDMAYSANKVATRLSATSQHAWEALRKGTAWRIRRRVASLLLRAGADVIPRRSLRHPLGRRRRLLDGMLVDLVLDVGANVGQYGYELREIGYQGQIVSFEPVLEAFQALARRARADSRWDAIHTAIGPSPGWSEVHVAGNGGASSSFLPMLPEVVIHAPAAAYVRTERVRVHRLDAMIQETVARADAVFLKADVQGYELEVLDSATGILPKVVGLQLEMSLVPLYDGAPSFMTLLGRAHDLGFDLVGFEPGFAAADGRLLQVDGLFDRRGIRP